MNKQISNWINKEFPRNYIIRKPIPGVLIIALFFFIFAVIYKPLNAHESKGLSYTETMAVYCLIAALAALIFILLIKQFNYFSDKKKWTFVKEVTAVLVILLGLGIVIYFAAFWLEPPANRWNFATFFDSVSNAFLIGIIPFIFFTSLSYHQWVTQRTSYHKTDSEEHPEEEKIEIQSRLKKEKLSFYPSQLVYTESDGNYVNFHLLHEGQLKKKVIRNSISDIEKQLTDIPFLFRTHRAFIVNLKQIKQKKGNASGYRLKVEGTNNEIPVSRKNTKQFEEKFDQYHF